MTREIRIGLIGHGFMGKAHSRAIRQLSALPDLGAAPVMKVIWVWLL